jgi:hypothetical protein
VQVVNYAQSAALSFDYARSASFFVVRFDSARFRFHFTKRKHLVFHQVPIYHRRCKTALACVVVNAFFYSCF